MALLTRGWEGGGLRTFQGPSIHHSPPKAHASTPPHGLAGPRSTIAIALQLLDAPAPS